jgi:membrane fusion protein, heavy metal efflux system
MTHRSIKLLIAAGLVTTLGSQVGWLPDGLSLSPAAASEQGDDHGEKEAGGHEEEESGVLMLDPDKLGGLKLSTAKVSKGELALTLDLPGEVQWDAGRIAHVVPRISGVVSEVDKALGDLVQEGDILAKLDSGELASTKAGYLAALAREEMAQANFDREKALWEQKISAEQDYLEAKNNLAEIQIQKQLAHRQLHAIGVPSEEIEGLATAPESELTLYRLKSPLSGVVVERHIVRGEMLDSDSQAYLIADPSHVWVIASVYAKDIAQVQVGQTAQVSLKAYPGRVFGGDITWIADAVDEQTRTLKVRVEVDNPDGFFKPGMFASIALAVAKKSDILTIPAAAIQIQAGEAIVFVDEGGGRYERREVRVGIRSQGTVEIIDGLLGGERVVTSGSFILKSELEKEGFGGDHH